MEYRANTPSGDAPSGEMDEKALARERKFGGASRWVYTVAAVGSVPVALWFARTNFPFAFIICLLGIINAIVAAINWRNWLKKSEADKAPLRFLPQLEVKDISVPFKRDDFNQVRKASNMNLSIAAIALLYTLGGVVALFSKLTPGLRLGAFAVGLLAGWVFWRCGKRFWRASKSLSCPGCKDLLTSQADDVLKSGCCRKCGRRVLVD